MPELGYLKANLSFLHAIDSLRKKKRAGLTEGTGNLGLAARWGPPLESLHS